MATAAAIVARARRDIHHHFFSADAVRPDRAVAFTPSRRIEGRQFERMARAGIIREASPGRYWLDVVAYDCDLRRRHRRIRNILLFIILLLLVTELAAFFRAGP